MDKKAASIIFFALFVASTASAFDILKLLEKESDLSSFSKALKDSKLADAINSRSTITVLAVSNGGASGLSGKSQDVVKKILSAHVVLDYFDEDKLTKLVKANKTATLTTMLQSSGMAQGEQGFLSVGIVGKEVAIGSAVKGAKMNTKLVKSVTTQPYNISVLEVSSLIDIPDIEASSPGGAPKRSTASPSPSPSDDDKAPSSSKTKKSPAAAPSSDDTVSSPPVSGDAATEAPKADAPAPSAASRVEMAFGVGLLMGVASLLG